MQKPLLMRTITMEECTKERLEGHMLGYWYRQKLVHGVRELYEQVVTDVQPEKDFPFADEHMTWPCEAGLCFPVFQARNVQDSEATTSPTLCQCTQDDERRASVDERTTGRASVDGSTTGPASVDGRTTGPASVNGRTTGPASVNGRTTGPASVNGRTTGHAAIAECVRTTDTAEDVCGDETTAENVQDGQCAGEDSQCRGWSMTNPAARIETSPTGAAVTAIHEAHKLVFNKDRELLLEMRGKLSMELLWLKQAIVSRQKYLELRKELDAPSP